MPEIIFRDWRGKITLRSQNRLAPSVLGFSGRNFFSSGLWSLRVTVDNLSPPSINSTVFGFVSGEEAFGTSGFSGTRRPLDVHMKRITMKLKWKEREHFPTHCQRPRRTEQAL